MKNFFLFIFAFAVFQTGIIATGLGPWEKEIEYVDTDQEIIIDVFTRDEPDNNYRAFNAKTIVNSGMPTVLAVLFNLDEFDRLFYSYKHSEVIYHNNEHYLYMQLDMTWPIESRDVVLKETINQVNDYSVIITATNASDIYPKQEGHIRLFDSEAKWRIKPLSPTQTLVEFYGHTNPSGTIPSWVLNLMLSDIPKETLKNLHHLVQEPRYKQATLETLENPYVDLSFIKLPYKEVVDKS